MMNTIEMKHNMAISAARMLERRLSNEQKDMLEGIELKALALQGAEVISALMGSIVETCNQFFGQYEEVGIIVEAQKALYSEKPFKESIDFLLRHYNNNVIVKESTDVFVDLEYVRALTVMTLLDRDIYDFCMKESYFENRDFINECLSYSL